LGLNSKKNYIAKQLEMQDVPYAIIVGKLMHLVIDIWLDLAYVIGHCVQFMANPSPMHWVAIKHILHYLKHSNTWGIFYSSHAKQFF
jgi:hypothetical protein